jgi:predicted  nucleic acid-binding Zn-ribbon protein
MPHQCVRCNTFYPDAAKELLKGCSCGGRLFFYIKQSRLDEIKNQAEKKLTTDESFQMEQDVFSILGITPDQPVVLDFESVRMLEPGKYELDLVRLFKEKPVIFKISEGKYFIDIPNTMNRMRRK